MTFTMRDAHVRDALHVWLRSVHAHEMATARIVNELGIAGMVRADVAVFHNAFTAYEIKSASDTLRRLAKQVEVYSAVADFAYLVVASSHVHHAADLLPAWWGIIEAVPAGDTVELHLRRPARMNPQLDPYTLCSLLWRDEVLDELQLRGWDAGMRSKPRVALWERLANMLELDDLRTVVRDRIKRRQSWR